MQVTTSTANELYRSPDASLTVLIPPRMSANGLLFSFEQGDMTAEDIRDIVLVHTMERQLTFDDLLELDEEAVVPTLLSGAALKPSLDGATSGSTAGEPGLGTIGIIEADLDACADGSIMHTIKGILLPNNIVLPRTAAPRSIEVSEDSAPDSVSTTTLLAFLGGVGLLLLAILGLCAYCFCCGPKNRKSEPNHIDMAENFGPSTTTSSVPYWQHEVNPQQQPGTPSSPGYYGSNFSLPSRPGSGVQSAPSAGHYMGAAPTGMYSQNDMGYHPNATYSSDNHPNTSPAGSYNEHGSAGPFGITPVTPIGNIMDPLPPFESHYEGMMQLQHCLVQ